MSVDLLFGASPALDAERPIEAVGVGGASSQVVGGHVARVVVAGGSTDTVEALLLSVARGDQEAFVALESRMAGLVRVNVRRVLRDGARCEAATEQTFAGGTRGRHPFRSSPRQRPDVAADARTPASEGRASLRRRHGRPTHCHVEPFRPRYSGETGRGIRTRSPLLVVATGSAIAADDQGALMSTTGWIILIVVLLFVFGGFGFSRRRR